MSKKTNAIIAIFIALFIVFFGVTTAVLGIIRRGADGIIEAAVCIVACGIVCAILWFAFRDAFKAKPKSRRKVKKHVEKDDESQENYTSSKIAYFMLAFGLICLCGLFGGAIYFIVHMHGDKFVEVLAEVTETDDGVFYKYIADGKTVLSSEGSAWAGVHAVEGRTVKIFYEAGDPESFETYSAPVMLFMAGIFFLCIGLLGFCSYSHKPRFMPFLGCAGFLDFGIGLTVAVELSFGFSFFELMTSGASVFLVNIFTVFGLYFAVNLIIQTFKK